ncbi:NADP-dependent oxidoreductase domain-containing protein [Xylogone sp. PMI_703]|nr:NADP-dependent oxidoreductase domain-containing protein [Xylogone sp. PMI_703]
MAHVNMMTDTIIANLATDGLRSVIRGILASDPGITPIFEKQTRLYLQKSSSRSLGPIFKVDDKGRTIITDDFTSTQNRVRCMLGCGLCWDSLPILKSIVDRVTELNSSSQVLYDDKLLDILGSLDGDIIQTITALNKTLLGSKGTRDLSKNERESLGVLLNSLIMCSSKSKQAGLSFPFERGLGALLRLLVIPNVDSRETVTPKFQTLKKTQNWPPVDIETFQLQGITLPRLFCGLWQLSSPAWGSASHSNIINQFLQHVNAGFWAFDMADHYGDAEILFGEFRSSYEDPGSVFGATKYCIFQPTTITREIVRQNVTERCQRLNTDRVDLLQFHWQFYDDPHYIDALRFLQEDDRVKALGLCNFNTEHMKNVLDSGINIVTNQVQFSLIDSRPTINMGKVCREHNIKLLTYGTLCGGFLAEKWLDKPEPELFLDTITPSQRKYYEVIRIWGGWELFQELLHTLKHIAKSHRVSISNVATRWVLDFPYVGAVIVGVRMGVNEHTTENKASLGWELTQQDRDCIEEVLEKSQRSRMFELMGDCGGEYR